MADNSEPTAPTPEPQAATPVIFKPKKQIVDIKPGASSTDVLDAILKTNDDTILPWESCTLPSRGIYYGGKIPGGVVEARPMGIFADKILATQRLAKSGKSLDLLFKKCVRLPDGFDPLELLAGDRIFLLYFLRGITHGSDYEFMVTCTNPDCEKPSEHEYDLNQLFTTVKFANQELGPEPFKVSLPYLSEVTGQDFWVKLRLMRGRDTMSILMVQAHQKAKAGKKPESLDESFEQNLNLVIVEAMGSNDPAKIKALVGRLHSADTATLREFLKDNSPGLDTAVTLECPYCNHEMKIDLPITESFFRPKKRGGSG